MQQQPENSHDNFGRILNLSVPAQKGFKIILRLTVEVATAKLFPVHHFAFLATLFYVQKNKLKC